MGSYRRRWICALGCMVLGGCEGREAGADPSADLLASAFVTGGLEAAMQVTCELSPGTTALSREIRESSGLAIGRRNPSILWTHNDAGGEAQLFAVRTSGELVGRVTVTGADFVDWEDVVSAPCASGDCLFIADTGDNDGERDSVTIYEVAEPDSVAAATEAARPIHVRYPDGRWDSEAIFALPDGSLYLVTKGRNGAIALYRVPATSGSDQPIVLERVRELFPEPDEQDDRVTAAAASPDGRWVGIRSYRTLYFYPAAALTGAAALSPTTVDLRPLAEEQGEGMTIAEDGTVWLSSEAGNADSSPTLARLRCDLTG